MKRIFFSSVLVLSLLLAFLTIPSLAKTMNVLVYPFENTGDKQYSWISAGMTDTVINDLMGMKEVSVISNADRKKIIEEAKFILSGLVAQESMVKVGKLTGANVIFSGSYLVSGNNIRVIARLINVETGNAESSAKLDGSLEKIFDLQDKVVLTLLAETGKVNIPDVARVKITEAEKKKIAEKPRPKTDAYELYAKGLELQDINPKEALASFTKALEADENYVSALLEAGFTAGNTLNLFDEALGYLTRADNILKSRKATNIAYYASLMKIIGAVYGIKGDLDRALKYYLDSQQIWDRLGLQNTKDYAGLMLNIGNVFASKDDMDRALRHFTDSQQIWDRLGLQNTKDYASILFNMGLVYEKQGNRGMAGKYYRKSYDTFVRVGYIGPSKDKALKNAQRLGY
jgi:TolB-like protein